MTYLERLMELVPPPKEPMCAGSPEQWPEVEQKLGTTLPDNYKIFINKYGSGGFYGFLEVISSFRLRNDLVSKFWQSRDFYITNGFFPVYPDPGGLLLAGGDENGNSLHWLTKGEPNEWPLVYLEDEHAGYELYEMTLAQFLVEWISGKIEPNVMQGLNLKSHKVPIFMPSTPRQLGL